MNLCRWTVLAFLRNTLSRRHRLWQAAQAVAPLKEGAVRVRRPLTADGLRALVARLPGRCGVQAWAMATTGMGWREYSGRWEREGEGLRIHGTKTGHRDRLIPLVGPITRPTTTIFASRYHLTAAGTPGQREAARWADKGTSGQRITKLITGEIAARGDRVAAGRSARGRGHRGASPAGKAGLARNDPGGAQAMGCTGD